MKLFCLQGNLKDALNIVERSVGQNSTLPVLSNIFLEADNSQLKISATNLEIGIITWIPSKVEEKGEICVQSKIISGFINNINNGKTEIELKNKTLNIKKDNYKANILTTNSKNFPIIPKIKSNKKIKIKQKDLKNGINKTINSAATNNLKPEITGIYFNFKKNNLKTVSTDSFRLAEKQINFEGVIEDKTNFILPIKTAQELSRLLKDGEDDVILLLDQNQIMFDFNNIQIFSKLIDGQYPNYEQIMPKNFKTKSIVKKQDFLSALKIASVFCGKNNDIKIKINKNSVEIVSQDNEKGENENELEAKTNGPGLDAVFNYRYLIDGLNNIDDEDIVLNFNEKNTPVLITGQKEGDYNYIVMPVRSI